MMCAKSLSSVPLFCNPMDCSQLGSSVHGILQARILEWIALPQSVPSPARKLEAGKGLARLAQAEQPLGRGPSPGDLPTQGSNPGLPHCRWILYQLSHKGTPILK